MIYIFKNNFYFHSWSVNQTWLNLLVDDHQWGSNITELKNKTLHMRLIMFIYLFIFGGEIS